MLKQRKVRDSCGESGSKGDPAGASREGSRTARGKKVHGVNQRLNCKSHKKM
ncbi:hypothetical protein [Peribacillus simplex]|uniref:hypothetical protein n=1 Tax=Peribacillus simplex TaxID=1478 RepID=UPI003D2AB04D